MHSPVHAVASRRIRQRRRWSCGAGRTHHLRRPGGIMNFKGHRERRLSHEIEAVAAISSGHFRRKMTIVEIIIAELHCLSNGGHRVDCSASYVRDGKGCTKWDRRDGFTKNKEIAYVLAPEQKMFRDRTEPTLFRAGTVPETVPVWSLWKNE